VQPPHTKGGMRRAERGDGNGAILVILWSHSVRAISPMQELLALAAKLGRIFTPLEWQPYHLSIQYWLGPSVKVDFRIRAVPASTVSSLRPQSGGQLRRIWHV
jgi:hypothetical protein